MSYTKKFNYYILSQFIFCCAILALIYKEHLLNLDTNLLFSTGDPALNMYFLEWGSKYILNDIPNYINSIFSLPIAYPYENSLSFSDNLFGNLLIFLPLYIITDDNILSYNIFILVNYFFNFFSMSFFLSNTKLINYKTNYYKYVLSTLGGLVFAFSLPSITLLGGHFQLLPMFFIPISIYFYEKVWLSNLTKDHILFALALSMQFYLGIQLGFFLLILLLALLPYYYFNRKVQIKEILKNMPYSILIVLALVGSLLYPYLETSKLTGFRSFSSDVLPNIPHLNDFFTTANSYYFNSWLSLGTKKHGEKAIFLGFGFFFLLLIFFIKRIKINKKEFLISFNSISHNTFYIFCGFIFLSLFLVKESHIFHIFFNSIPGFNSIRTPGRFVLVVDFVFALLIINRLKDFKLIKLNIILTIFIFIFLTEVYSIKIPSHEYKSKLFSYSDQQKYKSYIKGPSIIFPLYNMPVGKYIPSLVLKMINFSFYTPILNIYSGNFPKFNDEISKQYNNIKTREDLNNFINRIRKLGFYNIVLDKTKSLNLNKNIEKLLDENENVINIYNDNKISIWPLKKKLSVYYPSLNNSIKGKSGFFHPVSMKIQGSHVEMKGKLQHNELYGVVQKRENILYPFLMSNDGNNFKKINCNLILDDLIDAFDEVECIFNSNIIKDSFYFKNIDKNKIYNIKKITPNIKPLSEFKMKIKVLSVKTIDNKANVKIKLTNISKETWNAGYRGKYGLAISYSIENKKKLINTGFNARIHLPSDMAPNKSLIINIPIHNLKVGHNKINFSMVQELVAWFHDRRSNITETNIIIKDNKKYE